MHSGIFRRAVFALVLASPAVIGPTSALHAQESKIAFHSNRDGNLEIYVANPDGTGEMRLTNHPAGDYSPSWSPDRTKVTFSSTRGGDLEIYVMDADRPEGPDNVPTPLTNSPEESLWPNWSPDGTRIAFYSSRDGGNRDIYVMNADGTNQTRLTNHAAADRSPSWSPDGTKIAFSSERSGNREIWVADIDLFSIPPNLSNLQNLTNHGSTDDYPSWSPDGNRIAFISNRDFTSTYDVYVMNADGTSQIRLTADSADDGVFINPWSPDGSQFVFDSTRTGGGDIYVMNADGTDQIPISTNAANDGAPSWSLSGGTASCVSPPGGMLAWWPGDGDASDIRGSNDGTLQNGATFATGRVGQAFNLDGVDDFVEIPDSDLWAFGSSDFTIDLWARFTSANCGPMDNSRCVFIATDEGGGPQDKWLFAVSPTSHASTSGNHLYFHVNQQGAPSGSFVALHPFSPDLNRWYHFAVTKQAALYTIYVDGTAVSSETNATPIPNADAPLRLGRAEGAIPGGTFPGLLDEIEIYNRALPPQEIRAIVDAGGAGKCRVPAKRVIIIDVDGLRADVMFEATTPGADALFGANRRFYTRAWTIFPSVTLAGHASIFTGSYPGVHGIVGNEWFDRTFNSGSSIPNPYPCPGTSTSEVDNGTIGYLCTPPGKLRKVTDRLALLNAVCVVSPQSQIVAADFCAMPDDLDPLCTGPTEGLANAHLANPTIYERLGVAPVGFSSAVNFNQYWRGAGTHLAPDFGDLANYTCAYTDNDGLRGCFNCPEEANTRSQFAGYDALGLLRLTARLEQSANDELMVFYFAGVDGYCHHMYEESGAQKDVKSCQIGYVEQLLDNQLRFLRDALEEADPTWRDHTLLILTADHGMTAASEPAFDIHEEVAQLLGDLLCDFGDCDDDPMDRDVTMTVNGGMAHIYIRNRDTHNWADVPLPADLDRVARALLARRELRQVIDSVQLRPNGWGSGYRRVTLSVTRRPILGLDSGYDPRRNLLVQKLDSIRSGDILVVLKDGYYFDNVQQYPGNHGGLAGTDLNVPLIVSGPGVTGGLDISEAGNSQILSTAYRFLTGDDLASGEVEPPLSLSSVP